MALVLKDRVKETSTTTGTGTFTLAGAATGFQSFSVIGNGNTTFYTIVDSAAGAWEVGIGTYTSSGTLLSRDTVLESSNSGSLVNFGSGSKDVFVTYPAERAVVINGSGTLTGVSGTVLNVSNYQTGTVATGTTAIPFDNTIPQITEGTEFMSLAFTPTSATSKLLIQVVFMGTNTTVASAGFCVALFKVGTSNALASTFNSVANSSISEFLINHYMTSGTTSSITFTVRAGSANSGITSFNGQSGSQFGGGSLASSITITEIAA